MAGSRWVRLGSALLALGLLSTTGCGDGATAANDAGYIAGKRDACTESGGSWDADSASCAAADSVLFVINAEGMSVAGDRLTLTGVDDKMLAFADRPQRTAGWMGAEDIVALWNEGANSFATDPPNAVVAWQSGRRSLDVVVTLSSPAWDAAAGALSFTATPVVDGGSTTLADFDGPVSLVVDDFSSVITDGIGDTFAGLASIGLIWPCWFGDTSACEDICALLQPVEGGCKYDWVSATDFCDCS